MTNEEIARSLEGLAKAVRTGEPLAAVTATRVLELEGAATRVVEELDSGSDWHRLKQRIGELDCALRSGKQTPAELLGISLPVYMLRRELDAGTVKSTASENLARTLDQVLGALEGKRR